MSFINNPDNINVDNDISIIDPEMEKKPKLTIAGEILQDSFFNHIALIQFIFLEFINLTFMGRINNSNDKLYDFSYFNYCQIGFSFLNIFGNFYVLGIIKTLNYNSELLTRYITLKKILLLIILFIIIPFSLCSIFILKFIFLPIFSKNQILRYEISLNLNNIYYEMILYSPIYLLFFYLYELNLKFFQKNNMRSSALSFIFIFTFMHFLLSYILIFKNNYKIKGITFSMILTSLFCYLSTNYTITDECYTNKKIQNFYFFPKRNKFIDIYLKNSINEILIKGFYLFIDFLPYEFFLLFSLFIGNEELSSNIILRNFYLFLNAIGKGLSSTLKNYIQYSSIGNKHSHQAKIKYVKIFTYIVFSIILFCGLILSIFRGKISFLYLKNGGNEIIQKDLNNLYILYTMCVCLNYISFELEGYVKGINIDNNILLYRIIFPIIFIPIGFTSCFLFKYGIFGLWFGIFLMILFYSLPNAIKVYKFYDLFFQK